MEEERQYHPLPMAIDSNDESEVTKSGRDIPPAHYILKIDSFSVLTSFLTVAKLNSYESEVFEASGYKWKLSLYPNGDMKNHGEGYISLYLVIEETANLPPGWEVNVDFKFFVYDQIRDKYLTLQDVDGKVRRFHKMKTEWGFTKLLPLGAFKDAVNGYLIHDKCVFGAEVFVINYSGRGERLSMLKELTNVYTWKIEKFSSLNQTFHRSEAFTLRGRTWRFVLHPKGDPNKRNAELGLFLELHDLGAPPAGKVFADFLLRVKDQMHGKHRERTAQHCFSSKAIDWGFSSFLPLADLHDTSKGFLVEDNMIIEAEISIISTIEVFSK